MTESTKTTAARRLYLVTPTDPAPDAVAQLVAASHPNVALAAVARATFTVSVPTALQVAALVAAGATVKEA